MAEFAIRAIIVDGDDGAREHLRHLAQTQHDVDIVAEFADGHDAADALRSLTADVVFLDVDIPRLDGFGVLAEVGVDRMPPFVFTSVFTHAAVRAYETPAIDYLLKPFDDVRFDATLRRVRSRLAQRRTTVPATGPESEMHARLSTLIDQLERAGEHFPSAIAIRSGGEYAVVRVAEIDWIEADGNYVKVHVNQRPRLLTKTLSALERDVLDPGVFARVHRSTIVNTTKIAGVESGFHGELTLVLVDGTRVHCSRRFRKNLEARLYFTS